MSNSLRILLAFIFTIILAVILTPISGQLYDNFFIVGAGFFWGPSHPEYIPGFIIAYMFSLPLFFISLLEKKVILWLLVGIFPVVFLILWARQGNTLIMGSIIFFFGTLLGLLSDKLARIGGKE